LETEKRDLGQSRYSWSPVHTHHHIKPTKTPADTGMSASAKKAAAEKAAADKAAEEQEKQLQQEKEAAAEETQRKAKKVAAKKAAANKAAADKAAADHMKKKAAAGKEQVKSKRKTPAAVSFDDQVDSNTELPQSKRRRMRKSPDDEEQETPQKSSGRKGVKRKADASESDSRHKKKFIDLLRWLCSPRCRLCVSACVWWQDRW
jgi:hypothetical protein